MSYSKGSEINITWQIENAKFREALYGYEFDFKWPLTKSKWKLKYLGATFPSGSFRRYQVMHIIPEESKEQFNLYGVISIITADNSCHHLREFALKNFNKKLIVINLLDLEQIALPLDILLHNNALTFRIRLWDSLEKIACVNYHVCTKSYTKEHSFMWIVDTTKLAKGFLWDNSYHEYFKEVSTGLKDGPNKEDNITFKLYFESFLEKKCLYYIEFYPVDIHGEIKVDAIGKDGNILNLLTDNILLFNSHKFRSIRYTFDSDKIHDLIKSKDHYYPEKYLTLNIYLNATSYLPPEIKEDYLSDTSNVITLREQLNIYHESDHLENNLPDTLSASMYSLYKEGCLCDVTLSVGKEQFLCHKVVLSARSPVFRVMFEKETQEKMNSSVDITDIDADTFRIFLNALYTDSLLDVDWDGVLRVYKAFDKYDILPLRKMSKKYLLSKLSMTNICQLLDLCDAHEDNDLKNEVKTYFIHNVKEVVMLPEWKNFVLKNSAFAAQLMQIYLESM